MDLKMYHDVIEELLEAQDARAKFLEKNCGFMYAEAFRGIVNLSLTGAAKNAVEVFCGIFIMIF